MPYTYTWPRPSVTVDGVVFGYDPGVSTLNVLLIRRGDEPFKDQWAIPGGFVNVRDDEGQGEDLETAVRRELEEETGIKLAYLEQLQTFGTPGRDPRGRVISVAYFALVRSKEYKPVGGDDAAEAQWFSLIGSKAEGRGAHEILLQDGDGLVGDATGRWGAIAFDHGKILKVALARLQAKVRYAPIGFNLLPPTFTIGELQRLYEAILMRGIEKRNFYRKVHRLGILAEAGVQKNVSHRSGKLYRFDKRAYDKAVHDGFNFEL